MAKLSLSSEVILDAAWNASTDTPVKEIQQIVAATLKALVRQEAYYLDVDNFGWDIRKVIEVDDILTIAEELENG